MRKLRYILWRKVIQSAIIGIIYFPMKMGRLELLMGVETPIPPKMIIAAAPDEAPPRRIKTVEIIICRFSWLGCEPDQFMLVSHEN